ncbi:hypothetical protein RND81_11G159100 [Saponaria officinalis]|uniref:Uncharacterized protein n=1 Tax=Saponaria officinalis TaxID=3572 RepID=A0AAW1HMQ2_SAPOF
MEQKIKALSIGLVGTAITLSAYYQTTYSPSNGIVIGFLVLCFALLVHEGFISI